MNLFSSIRLQWQVVPTRSRAFAIGLQVVFIHALGDVPSPIVIGAIKDALAPHSMKLPDSDAYTDEGRDKLRLVMMITLSWLVWTIAFWRIGYLLMCRFQSQRQQRRQDEEHSALLNFT